MATTKRKAANPKRKAATKTTAKGRTRKATRARTPARRKRATPRGPGHPTHLTEATQAATVGLIAVGNYFEPAVRSAGLSPSTAYGWMARGRRELERRAGEASEHDVDEQTPEDEQARIVRDLDPETWDREGRFVEFLEAVQKAESDAEAYAVTTLRSLMGPTNDGQVRARAALGYLERKHPRRWSRAERSEVLVDSTSRVEVVPPDRGGTEGAHRGDARRPRGDRRARAGGGVARGAARRRRGRGRRRHVRYQRSEIAVADDAAWLEAVARVSRTTTYHPDEVADAAMVARRGKVPAAVTPEGFVEVAQWCAGGDLNLYGYLVTVEELAWESEAVKDRQRRERVRDVLTAVALLVGVAALLAAAIVFLGVAL